MEPDSLERGDSFIFIGVPGCTLYMGMILFVLIEHIFFVRSESPTKNVILPTLVGCFFRE